MTAASPLQALPSARYALTQMLGAGEDGAAYLARDGAGDHYIVHRLKKLGFERRRQLEQRLKLRRLVKGVRVVGIVTAELDGDEPSVVFERVEGSLGQLLHTGSLERDMALKIIHSAAQAIAELHRVGLMHGGLCPEAVRLREDLTVSLEPLLPATGAWEDDPRCRAPDVEPGMPADLYSLGVLLSLALEGKPPPPPDETVTGVHGVPKDEARMLIKELLDAEPSWRPTADDAVLRLRHLLDSAAVPDDETPTLDPKGEPKRLGRFRIEGLIGRGAMGRVYRAIDEGDGSLVALKLLDQATQTSLSSLRRFRKEARMLSEVNNPYISNLIETNRDQGIYFMAVELVEGKDLSAQLKAKGPFTEAEALGICADVTRALVEVHARGIIHRDIKPANIITLDVPVNGARVKLVDFGIARHVDEHASLQLTEAGASIGTPVYMSPEQCKGDVLDGKSDVYSLAVTLFALVAGRPPFVTNEGSGPEAIFSKHLFEVAPLLTQVVPHASPALASLLARCLEKDPRQRPTAEELLADLEHLLKNDATGIAGHPAKPKQTDTVVYRFEWNMRASPRALWQYVSNTDRINRAIGLGPVEQSFKTVEGEIQRFGTSPSWPFTLHWLEHPFEWVSGKRLGVLREMQEGPLRWFRSTVDLERKDNGSTRLIHTIELEPRGMVGRAAAAVEIGVRVRLALSKVYQRIDEILGQSVDTMATFADAFEMPHQLEVEQEERLSRIEKRMVDQGSDLVATARLGDFVRHAASQEVSRIRPLALARKLNLDPAQLVMTCLWAAREGALELKWDLVCPSCRVPSEIKDTLRAVKEHGRCEVCNIDYALDLASSVELVFSAHPAIRSSDRAFYCLSSPGHVPHVHAQVRIAKGERMELHLSLDEGRYQVVGRHLPFTLDFRVRERAGATRWEVQLSRGMRTDAGRMMTAGSQVLVLENDTDREQLVRVERAKGSEDALTAAKVASQPLFRRLFPTEVLAPGQLVNVSNVALLMVEVAQDADRPQTDSGSFSGRYALFRRLEEKAASFSGAVVKIAGEGVVAVFADVTDAVRAALSFGDDPLPLRVAVHKGPAAAVTLDEHMDYFGRTVRETARLLTCGGSRELVMSEVAASDPGVRSVTQSRAIRGKVDTRLGVPCQVVPLVE